MKERFFERIGQWTTPPCIRKCSASLKALTLLLVMGLSVNVWGATAGDVFSKITKISDLADGDEIIFVNSDGTSAMSTTQNTNNRGSVTITTKNGRWTYPTGTSTVQILTVKVVDGKYGFHTGSGYLYSASTSKNYLNTTTTPITTAPTTTSLWSLSIAESGNTNQTVTMQNGTNTAYCIQWNGTTVSQYKNTQANGCIYKKAPVIPVTSLILSEAGVEKSVLNGQNVGDTYELPSSDATCGDKTFVGWSTEEIQTPGDKPESNFYKPGDKVTLEDNNTFYAVFAEKKTETVTKEIKNLSFTAAEDVTYSTGDDNLEMHFLKGGSGTNPGNYNNGVRLYQAVSGKSFGGYITIESTIGNITEVSFQNTNTYATSVKYSTDKGTTLSDVESVAKSGVIKKEGLSTKSFYLYNVGTTSSTRLEIDLITIKYEGGQYSNYTTSCGAVYDATVADGITNGSVLISKTDDATAGATSLTGLKQGDKVYIFPTANTHYEVASVIVNSNPVTAAEGKYIYTIDEASITVSATFNKKQCTILGTPQNVQVTDKTYSGAKLTWDAVANADYYEVTILRNNETIESDKVTDEEYTISTTLLGNTEYSYSIVAGSNDEDTYCESNPAEGNFPTADYPAATLTLSENGVETPVNGKLNTAIELPATSTQACDGKVFVGWSENPIEGEVGKDQVTLLGETYTFTNPAVLAKTIYAVYAKESKGATTWNEVSAVADVKVGEYVIINSGYYLPNTTTSSSPVKNEAPTITDNKIADANVTAAMKWILSDAGNSKFYVKNSDGSYLYATSSSTGLRVSNTSDTWTFEANDGALAMKESNNSRYCASYKDGSDWRSYTSSNAANYGDGGKLYLYEKTVAASTYSNYCTTCVAAVAAPTFGLAEGNYNVAQTLTLTAAEGDIYYTINGGTETKYTAAIELDKRGTYEISAYAKVDDRTSETVTKTYTLDWAYTLDELAASDVADGTTVQVTFENKEITNFYTNSQGKRYGIYVNVQKGGKDVEIYCNKAEHSDSWEVGGKVSSTQAISGTWTYYSGGSQWEFCPSNWNDINYTAPAKITSLVIDGDVTNKNYTAGQKLDFTGLTVLGVYNDNTEQNPHKEDVTANVEWTEVTLAENQVEAIAKATLNNVETGNKDVSKSIEITGLTVGAKVELSKIEITTEASKKDFFVGRNFNHDGIVVTATYSNGSTSNVTNACDFSTPTLENKGQETVTITYSEGEGQDKKEVTTSYTINVKYMNLNDLVAEDVPTNTSVKVAFSDVEITGFYTNKSEQRTGVYVNVNGKNGANIELYSGGTPSATLNDWQEGGLISSKGDYITGTWKYYDGGSVWEIDFGTNYAWSTNIEYTAPEIYPTAIELSETTATVKQSKSLDLEAIFTPIDATVLNNLEWSSDNNQVIVAPSQDKKSAKVTVASDATVGTATITVKVDDKDGNKLSNACIVTIAAAPDFTKGGWMKVTSTDDLTEGGYYIIAAEKVDKAMESYASGNNCSYVAVAKDGDLLTYQTTAVPGIFELQAGKNNGQWALFDIETEKYLYAAGSSSSNYLKAQDSKNDDKASWKITIANGVAGIQAASNNRNTMSWNEGNSIFSCYGSVQTNGQLALYKHYDVLPTYLVSIAITGEPDVMKYALNRAFETTGLTVEGTYSDETTAPITEGIEWIIEPATFTELSDNASVTVTAKVGNKESEPVTIDGIKVVSPIYTDYELVTDASTLQAGDIIVFGSTYASTTTDHSKDGSFVNGLLGGNAYLASVSATIANGKLTAADAGEFTLGGEADAWTLTSVEGLVGTTGAKTLVVNSQTATNTWSIEIGENGTATISDGTNEMSYNGSSPRFTTYAATQNAIQIYRKPFVTVRENLTVGSYGTVCWPKDVVSYTGATFYQADNKDEGAHEMYFNEVTDGEKLNAGQAYLFQATDATIQFKEGANEVVDPISGEAARGFYGVFERQECLSDREWYGIYGTKIQPMAAGAGVPANRAYIKLDEVPTESYVEAGAPAPRRLAMVMPKSTATDLYLIYNPEEGARKMMMNNQIIIIREGRHYNVHGQMLK